MTLRIGLHARGLLIEVPEGVGRSAIGRRLRSRIPWDQVLSSTGQFIVPSANAHQVAEEFVDDEAVWDKTAWEYVTRQRNLLARMASAKLEVAEALRNPRQALDDYMLLNRLDDHQVEAVAAICVPSLVGLALFDEQGLGKTITALCAFDRLREQRLIDRLIVLAPKSVLASWLADIQKLFGEKYVVQVPSGDSMSRRRQIRSRFDILLCGYETAVAELPNLKSVVRHDNGRFMLVIDESYFIKNPDARRSQAVAVLTTQVDRILLLCGTPAPNSPKDLVHQLDTVQMGLATLSKLVPKDDAELEDFVLKALDNIVYLRRLKQEVFLEMPTKQLEKLFVELAPAQRAMYDEAHDELVLAVRSVDDHEFRRNLGSFLARRAVLLQICSHPGAVDPLYSEVPAKLLALDRLVEDLITIQGQKVVIWSFYRYSLKAIANRYSAYGLVRVDGSVARLDERRQAIQRFQEDKEVKIFLGNAAAAGAGITLTAAHHAIYESFSNQAAHYMQSVDRIHRRGQEYDVTYHILLAQNTLEKSEFDRLLDKERAGRLLLGDHYQEPMTRERFLAELDMARP